jgi:hypothetical protein
MPCKQRGSKHFDVIVYGDEPAGVMTALELEQRMRQLVGIAKPHIALVTSADTRLGLGGTIARSGLSYLDRNQVPEDMWGLLPPFSPSSALYQRFLRLTGVEKIAVEPLNASRSFSAALKRTGIPVFSQTGLVGAAKEGDRLCFLHSSRYGKLGADLFIDASLGAGLAVRSGVAFRPGLGPRGLSRESIALGWIFQVQGMNLRSFQALEERLTRRLLDRHDIKAQQWMSSWKRYSRPRTTLARKLLDEQGRPRLAFSTTSDSADQRSPAIAIAFHGEEKIPPGLVKGSALLDQANIAILNDRLSLNALLFNNTAAQNRKVLESGSRPLPAMVPVAQAVTRFFLRHGARRVIWMPELYVRSADQIANPLEALSADLMAQGGVPRDQALGTFTYNLDFRGGLSELIPRGRPTFNFGYRHTIPRDLANLAILGPSSGYGGLGEGAGRIIELNVSVGQGLAIASALAVKQHSSLADVDPHQVADLMPAGTVPYGRATGSTIFSLFLQRVLYRLDHWLPKRLENALWEAL